MDKENLKKYVENQIENIFISNISCSNYMQESIDMTMRCFSASSNKYLFKQSQENEIDPFHSVGYTIFLYNLSKTMYKIDGNGNRAEKVYYLNKLLNSVDLFYAIDFPEVWGAEHPLGSVMGRAKYGNNFFFYQGCNVGGNKNDYPVLEDNVLMFSDSKILGRSKIGSHVIFAANSYVINCDVPSYSMVFPSIDSRHPIIKQISVEYYKNITKNIWK